MNTDIDNCITSAEYLLHWEDNLHKPAAQWSEPTKDKWLLKYQSRKKNLEKALVYLNKHNDSKSQKVRSILYQLDTLSAQIGNIVNNQTTTSNNTTLGTKRHKKKSIAINAQHFEKKSIPHNEKQLSKSDLLKLIIKGREEYLSNSRGCKTAIGLFEDRLKKENSNECRQILEDAITKFQKQYEQLIKIERQKNTPTMITDEDVPKLNMLNRDSRVRFDLSSICTANIQQSSIAFNSNGEIISYDTVGISMDVYF